MGLALPPAARAAARAALHGGLFLRAYGAPKRLRNTRRSIPAPASASGPPCRAALKKPAFCLSGAGGPPGAPAAPAGPGIALYANPVCALGLRLARCGGGGGPPLSTVPQPRQGPQNKLAGAAFLLSPLPGLCPRAYTSLAECRSPPPPWTRLRSTRGGPGGPPPVGSGGLVSVRPPRVAAAGRGLERCCGRTGERTAQGSRPGLLPLILNYY